MVEVESEWLVHCEALLLLVSSWAATLLWPLCTLTKDSCEPGAERVGGGGAAWAWCRLRVAAAAGLTFSAAGGGVALQIPVPLGVRQRRRQAFQWILDAASKRQNRGSGRDTFPLRVAQELINVVEGKSGVWDRRDAVHKLGTTARSNLNYGRGVRGRR